MRGVAHTGFFTDFVVKRSDFQASAREWTCWARMCTYRSESKVPRRSKAPETRESMPDPITIVTAMVVAAAVAAALLLICSHSGGPRRLCRIRLGPGAGGWFLPGLVGARQPPALAAWRRSRPAAGPGASGRRDRRAAGGGGRECLRWLTWPLPRGRRPVRGTRLAARDSLPERPERAGDSRMVEDPGGHDPGWAGGIAGNGLVAISFAVFPGTRRVCGCVPGDHKRLGCDRGDAFAGYITGGQDGLTLAADSRGSCPHGFHPQVVVGGRLPLGVAVVGLYSLLLIGRFFGELSSAEAVLLFASPLLAWIPELPIVNRLPRWARTLARAVLVGLAASRDPGRRGQKAPRRRSFRRAIQPQRN